MAIVHAYVLQAAGLPNGSACLLACSSVLQAPPKARLAGFSSAPLWG